MKVVGVISSANFHGHGATLVREALGAVAAEGAATEEIFLPKFRIEFCLGCLRCLAEGKCHQTDDFETMRSLLREADGIILGAPTFGAAPNARMKNFLDRLGMFEYVTGSLGGRHLAAISTASSPATAGKVAKGLAGLLAERGLWAGLHLGHHGRQGAGAREPTGRRVPPKGPGARQAAGERHQARPETPGTGAPQDGAQSPDTETHVSRGHSQVPGRHDEGGIRQPQAEGLDPGPGRHGCAGRSP